MKTERKRLKIPLKMGKLMDLVPGDVREDISREKMAGPLLNRGGPPLPLLPGGKQR